jgi:TonB family protein
MDAVTAVLLERATGQGGLPRMVTVSLAAHVALVVGLVAWSALAPASSEDELRPVMTVSLGGAPGPRAGGMTMLGRPIQTTALLPEVGRPAPLRRPEAAPPAMMMPDPRAKPVRVPPKPARGADAGSARPSNIGTAGANKTAPSTEANPNQGLGFGGLSTGGGGGAGGYLDVQNFCCPDYLVTMLQLVQKNWNSRQEVDGETIVKFRIQRDGRITEIELERSSGYAALDLTAQRALFLTQRVLPLPSAFPDDHLTVHLRFPYQR